MTTQDPASAATGRSSTLGRFFRLAQKELRETLRDRRTIATLVLMPVLVYPLLGVTFQKFFLAQFAVQAPTEYHVALESMEAAVEFRDAFSVGNQLLGKELNPGTPLPPKAGELSEPSLRFVYPSDGAEVELDRLIARQDADLGVRVVRQGNGQPSRFEFVTRKGSVLSRDALEFVERRLRAVNDAFVANYLRRQSPPVELPMQWSDHRIDGSGGSDFSLATLVPLVLILMTVTGAVYPAIDLTAGERERGTLEALIAAPVAGADVLLAKYAAVVSVASLTALMNLAAMIVTAYAIGMEKTLFGSDGLSLTLLLQILLLLVVFAGFFSALILAITSNARSFKEAQAYLIPVMLLSLAPGIMALMPGLELSAGLAMVPLLNIVVLARDLLAGHAMGSLGLLALGASMVYAAIALTVATRIFGTDSVLYGSSGTWTESLRRPTETRRTPSLALGMTALAVLVPGYLLLGGIPARLTTLSLTARLAVSAGLTILLFAVWPLLLATYSRIRVRDGFGLRPASLLAFAGAVLLGLSLWPLAYELEVRTISRERLEQLVELFRGFKEELERIPLAWKVFALAVVPASCEELFFRGFLFRAIASRKSALFTILATAALFGLFHVMVRDALMFERFLPTGAMGLVLGWVAWRTGSVWPGMLLHVLHNSSVLIATDRLSDQTGGGEQTSLPIAVLGTAVAVAAVGAVLISRVRPVPAADDVPRDLSR